MALYSSDATYMFFCLFYLFYWVGVQLMGCNLNASLFSECNLHCCLFGIQLIWLFISGMQLTWLFISGIQLTSRCLLIFGVQLTWLFISGMQLTWLFLYNLYYFVQPLIFVFIIHRCKNFNKVTTGFTENKKLKKVY